MVIDFNNQIAFTKLQNKSFLRAETEPREHKTGESVFGLKSFLEPEAGGGPRRPAEPEVGSLD